MPKEKRCDNLEYERRIRTVQEWILQNQSYVDIMKQAMMKWNVSDRQAKNYIRRSYDEWKKSNELKMEDLVHSAIERRKKLARQLEQKYANRPDGISVLLAIEKDMDKLRGLYVEKQESRLVDKEGNDVQQTDLSNLTDDELRQLAELQRKSRARET